MGIGFGFSKEKIQFWKDFEDLFHKAYPDLKYGEGVYIPVIMDIQAKKMIEWTKALGKAMKDSKNEEITQVFE